MTIKEQLALALSNAEDSTMKLRRNAELATRLTHGMELEKTEVNAYGESIWFSTTSRTDLEKLLSMAPRGQHWSKDAWSDQLSYAVEIEGVSIKVNVTEDALPPTCKVVLVEEEIPATPARIVKRRVLKCNEPIESEEPSDKPVVHHGLEQAALDEAREIEKYGRDTF